MNRRWRDAWADRLRLATLTLVTLPLWMNSAEAQFDSIAMIVGPPQDVAGGPQFAMMWKSMFPWIRWSFGVRAGRYPMRLSFIFPEPCPDASWPLVLA